MIPIHPQPEPGASTSPDIKDIQHYMRDGTLRLAALPPLSNDINAPLEPMVAPAERHLRMSSSFINHLYFRQ